MSYVLLYSGVGVSKALTVNSSNAIILAHQSLATSSSGVILNEALRTVSSNACIAAHTTKTASENAIIKGTITDTVSSNAIIERAHKNATSNAEIASHKTKTVSTNAIVRDTATHTANVNAVISVHNLKTPHSSAIIVGGGSLIPSNAEIALRSTKTPSSNAAISGVVTKTTSSNASIATGHSISTGSNAIILVIKQLVPSSNAVIFNAGETAVNTSSNAVVAGIISRGAISDIIMFAEYLRILGILMLVDPSFQTELNTVPSQQTFTFVKKVVKGLFYVDIGGAGATLTGQVKTGDGTAYSHQVDVSVRIIGDTVTGATVSVGSALGGSGTKELWVQTTASGAFTLTITGTGPVLIEMTPKQGVIMSQSLLL